jgi:hypothetical protein
VVLTLKGNVGVFKGPLICWLSQPAMDVSGSGPSLSGSQDNVLPPQSPQQFKKKA